MACPVDLDPANLPHLSVETCLALQVQRCRRKLSGTTPTSPTPVTRAQVLIHSSGTCHLSPAPTAATQTLPGRSESLAPLCLPFRALGFLAGDRIWGFCCLQPGMKVKIKKKHLIGRRDVWVTLTQGSRAHGHSRSPTATDGVFHILRVPITSVPVLQQNFFFFFLAILSGNFFFRNCFTYLAVFFK